VGKERGVGGGTALGGRGAAAQTGREKAEDATETVNARWDPHARGSAGRTRGRQNHGWRRCPYNIFRVEIASLQLAHFFRSDSWATNTFLQVTAVAWAWHYALMPACAEVMHACKLAFCMAACLHAVHKNLTLQPHVAKRLLCSCTAFE
jgi:hypothetical protein